MKNILLAFCSILFFNFFVDAQAEIYIDPRLTEVYDQDYLTNLSNNSPDEILYLNWYLDNSYTILEVDENKMEGLSYLQYINIQTEEIGENVQNIDELNFNILLYHIKPDYNRAVTYRIGDTGKILVVNSSKKMSEKYNKHINYGN